MNLRSVSVAPRQDVTSSTSSVRQSVSPAAPVDMDESPQAVPTPEQPKRRSRFALWAGIAAVALGVVGYVYLQRGLESTDDAQVDADVLSVPARIGGTVLSVQFEENQNGHFLIELINISGQVIQQKSVNLSASSRVDFDLAGHPAKGLYVIRAKDLSHNKQYITKVQVQ